MVYIGKSGISEQDEGQVHLAESLNSGLSFSNQAFIPVAQKVEHAASNNMGHGFTSQGCTSF